MKRSRVISLGLLLGGTAVTFYACKGPEVPNVLAFSGDRADVLRQCSANGIPARTCEEAYAVAEAAHQQGAPRFASKEECERAMDSACEFAPTLRPDGNMMNGIAPVMTGILLTRAFSGVLTSFSSSTAMYRSLRDPDAYRPMGSFTGGWVGGGAAASAPASGAKGVASGRGGFGAFGGGGRGGS